MAVPGWVGPALSVASGFLGGDANGGLTGKLQRQSMRQQQAEFTKESALEDRMLGMVDSHANIYDPAKVLANLNTQDFRNQGLESGAIGAGYSAAGYRPGDTPVGDTLTRVGEQHQQYRDNLAVTLPQQLFSQQLGAYNQVREPNAAYPADVANEARNYQAPQSGLPSAIAAYLQYSAGQQKPATTPNPYQGQPTTLPSPGQLPNYGSGGYTPPKFDINNFKL